MFSVGKVVHDSVTSLTSQEVCEKKKGKKGKEGKPSFLLFCRKKMKLQICALLSSVKLSMEGMSKNISTFLSSRDELSPI